MSPGQSGQALVAVLVTMLLVFALGGGVVMVSSALLAQARSSSALDAELNSVSALNGALAQVADRGNPGGAGRTLPCGPPAALLAAVPTVPPAACMRVDSVSSTDTDRGRFALRWGNGASCSITNLPAAATSAGSPAHFVTWLLGRGATDAFVSTSDNRCPMRQGTMCSGLSTATVNGVFMAAFDCDLSSWSSGQRPYLHVVSSRSTPPYAWWAKYATLDNTYRTGTVYALAIPTGQATPDRLEADVLVVSDADPSRPPHHDGPTLFWQGSLP